MSSKPYAFCRSDREAALAGWRIADLEAVTSFSANGLLLKQARRYAPQDNREVSGGSI